LPVLSSLAVRAGENIFFSPLKKAITTSSLHRARQNWTQLPQMVTEQYNAGTHDFLWKAPEKFAYDIALMPQHGAA
jgi:hypothetical protein